MPAGIYISRSMIDLASRIHEVNIKKEVSEKGFLQNKIYYRLRRLTSGMESFWSSPISTLFTTAILKESVPTNTAT